MALQTSGQISLNDIHIEVGGTSGTEVSLNDTDVRGLISATSGAEMDFADWYGASNVFTFTVTSNTTDASLSTLATNAGWNGSSAIECTINSGVYLYATSTSTYGLTIDTSDVTLTNNGYIIGRGGAGVAYQNGGSGGAAMRIATGLSNISVTNSSGAYIAGGGGAGGGRGPGGGAGGGTTNNGSAGGPGSAGGNGSYVSFWKDFGSGGGAGGGGGRWTGGGGGRQLPGYGGGGAFNEGTGGGDGGGSNNAGQNGSWHTSGGGGGWSASGGAGTGSSATNPGVSAPYRTGGSGGRAISAGSTYSLSNSGTIWGGT